MDIRLLESDAEASQCATMMSSTDPWLKLGRTFDDCLAAIRNRDREVWVAHQDDRPAGFVILNMQGAFVGYIQSICVAAAFRGRGVGTELIDFVEKRVFRESPNVFLCVSSFNPRARKLYESLGYQLVGEMPDYLVRGHSELMMRKSIAPILDFQKAKKRT